jgi:PAS domain-containing protein
MRVTPSKTRSRRVAPAVGRRSRRWASRGARGRQPTLAEVQRAGDAPAQPVHWLAILCLMLIGAALIALIWLLTQRAIRDETADLRARTEQQVAAVAYVVALDVHGEMRMVDQSLAIIQQMWDAHPERVDLGAWRRRALALSDVTNDIFIANERGIIVQGTLPRSIGQGFGGAYVSYPNGGLELFEPDGTRVPTGRTDLSGVEGTRFKARQIVMYLVRPLASPPGFVVGASFRSDAITRLFAGANLGPSGVIALVDLKRGAIQAIVGESAQASQLDVSRSALVELMRNDISGVWTGPTPTDLMPRVIAFQRVEGRPIAVMAGVNIDSAEQSLSDLVAWAYILAILGTTIVVVIAGILIWVVATAQAARRRERDRDLADGNLATARREQTLAVTRAKLNAIEAATLISSPIDGVARVDESLRLRQWNHRFVELSGVALDESARGIRIEDFMSLQASAGMFGNAEQAEHALAARIAAFQTGGFAATRLTQRGTRGEAITMITRPAIDGGFMIILAQTGDTKSDDVPPTDHGAETESV